MQLSIVGRYTFLKPFGPARICRPGRHALSFFGNEILISENTYNLVKNEIKCNYYDKIQVKGKSHPIKTFQVVRKVQNKKVSQKINAASEGFSLSIDKNKIKDIDEVISVLENSIDKLTD